MKGLPLVWLLLAACEPSDLEQAGDAWDLLVRVDSYAEADGCEGPGEPIPAPASHLQLDLDPNPSEPLLTVRECRDAEDCGPLPWVQIDVEDATDEAIAGFNLQVSWMGGGATGEDGLCVVSWTSLAGTRAGRAVSLELRSASASLAAPDPGSCEQDALQRIDTECDRTRLISGTRVTR